MRHHQNYTNFVKTHILKKTRKKTLVDIVLLNRNMATLLTLTKNTKTQIKQHLMCLRDIY